MADMKLAAPVELTDADLDAIAAGTHTNTHGSLIDVDVHNILNNNDVDVTVKDINVAVLGKVRR